MKFRTARILLLLRLQIWWNRLQGIETVIMVPVDGGSCLRSFEAKKLEEKK